MKLYVGNLSFQTTEGDLQDLFEQYGEVREAVIIMDKMTHRSRGFAFVTMGSKEAGEAAIEGLNNKEVGGRKLAINEARPREDRPSGGGYGGGGERRSFSGGRR